MNLIKIIKTGLALVKTGVNFSTGKDLFSNPDKNDTKNFIFANSKLLITLSLINLGIIAIFNRELALAIIKIIPDLIKSLKAV